jgi:hypothetical protein
MPARTRRPTSAARRDAPGGIAAAAMRERPRMTPTPNAVPDPDTSAPAISEAGDDRVDQVRPEDSSGGPGGPYPDPDEYADPGAVTSDPGAGTS